MPTYEYECPRGHSFSRFDSVANWRELRPCEHPRCRETAQQFLRPSTGRFASFAKPIVVFKAKNGQIRIPGGADTKTPRGYDRVELTNLHEADSFERQYSERLRRHSSDLRAAHDEHFAEYMKSQRSELRAEMARMHPFARAVAELAMKKTDESRGKQRGGGGDFQAGFEVLHYDSGNREAQRDQSTNWKERRV